MEYYKTNTLEHHGIKGMHWGVRNGPPYPLSSKQKSSSERKGTPSKGAVVKKKVTGGNGSSRPQGYTKDDLDHATELFYRQEKSVKKIVDDFGIPGLRAESIVDFEDFNDSLSDYDLTDKQKKLFTKELKRLKDLDNTVEEMVDSMAADRDSKTGGINRNDWSRTEVTPGSNPKSPRAMSDSELKEYNARAGMEKKYTDYTTPKDNSVQNANYVNQIANATRAATDNIQRSADNEYKNAVAREKAKIDLSNVSDAELRQAVNRMNLERQYRDLTPVEIKSGEEKFKAAMDVIGPAVATAASVATIASVIYAMTHG